MGIAGLVVEKAPGYINTEHRDAAPTYLRQGDAQFRRPRNEGTGLLQRAFGRVVSPLRRQGLAQTRAMPREGGSEFGRTG